MQPLARASRGASCSAVARYRASTCGLAAGSTGRVLAHALHQGLPSGL
jgi:hypothetical protein